MRLVGRAARMGKRTGVMQGSGGETCRKRSLGGPRLRWQYNIEIGL